MFLICHAPSMLLSNKFNSWSMTLVTLFPSSMPDMASLLLLLAKPRVILESLPEKSHTAEKVRGTPGCLRRGDKWERGQMEQPMRSDKRLALEETDVKNEAQVMRPPLRVTVFNWPMGLRQHLCPSTSQHLPIPKDLLGAGIILGMEHISGKREKAPWPHEALTIMFPGKTL